MAHEHDSIADGWIETAVQRRIERQCVRGPSLRYARREVMDGDMPVPAFQRSIAAHAENPVNGHQRRDVFPVVPFVESRLRFGRDVRGDQQYPFRVLAAGLFFLQRSLRIETDTSAPAQNALRPG